MVTPKSDCLHRSSMVWCGKVQWIMSSVIKTRLIKVQNLLPHVPVWKNVLHEQERNRLRVNVVLITTFYAFYLKLDGRNKYFDLDITWCLKCYIFFISKLSEFHVTIGFWQSHKTLNHQTLVLNIWLWHHHRTYESYIHDSEYQLVKNTCSISVSFWIIKTYQNMVHFLIKHFL